MIRPNVSVVIPVYNNADTLAVQLDALAHSIDAAGEQAGSIEMLVVNNGSTDGSDRVASSWARSSNVPLRVIDASDRAGEPFARNQGLAAARGELVLYCDGDDLVAPTWIGGMVQVLAEYPYGTGPIDTQRLNPAWLANVRGSSVSGRSELFNSVPYAHGCNMGFRRADLIELGGFDESFVAGCDLEVAIRAWRQGWSLGYSRDALVHYRLRPSLRSTWKQGRFYGRYRIRLRKLLADVVDTGTERRANLRRLGWLAKFGPSALTSKQRRARWVWVASQLAGEAQGHLD